MFHMLHIEYEKTPQTFIFYTLAEYAVLLSFRHGFAGTEEKSMPHHTNMMPKLLLSALQKALWKTAWQKNPPSYDFGDSESWFPQTQTKIPGVDVPTATSLINIIQLKSWP